VSHNFQAGDVLAFSGRGCASRIIRACTLGPISHVGLVVNDSKTGIHCLAEALPTGFELTSIRKAMLKAAQTGTRVWHYRLRRPLSAEASEILFDLAAAMEGVPYDFTDVLYARTLGFGWLRHFIGWLGFLEEYEDNHKLFCSEWVALAHNVLNRTKFQYPSHWSPTLLCRYETWTRVVFPGVEVEWP